MKGLTIILFVVMAYASAEIELGTCPDWTNMQNFTLDPYVGRWFENERFSAGFQLDMTCVTADYGTVNATTITVTNTANLAGQVTGIQGYGYATGEPGQLLVYFPGNDPGYYNVLYTDYDTYACVYDCEQLGEYKQEYAWILARTMTLSAEDVTAAKQVFTDNGITLDKFNPTTQGDGCIYTPEP